MDGFKASLERVGFNEPTRQLIIDNGFVNVSSLDTVSDVDVIELIKNMGKWKERHITAAEGADTPPTVSLPFTLVIKICSICTCVITQ